MHKHNVNFSEFLNSCIGNILFDPSFDPDQLSAGVSDYFQAVALKNHYNFLEQPLPTVTMDWQDVQ